MSPSIPEWEEEVKAPKVKHKAPPHGPAGCLVMICLSATVIIATVVLGVQTRSGCELVANYLKSQTGIDLTVGGARFTGITEMTLTDVQTKPTTTPLGSFKVREMRIRLGLDGTLELALAGARLDVVKTADGWAPALFNKIASLDDVRETASLFSSEPGLVSLDVRDSGIIWNGPDGERLAAIEGMGISMRPVAMGLRRLMLIEVMARSVSRQGGVKGRLLQRLWVSVPENPYLEVEYRGSWEGDDAGAKDWWTPPPSTVKRGN
ncbi:MAG: hypothetical protein WCO77_05700 [bacterium]